MRSIGRSRSSSTDGSRVERGVRIVGRRCCRRRRPTTAVSKLADRREPKAPATLKIPAQMSRGMAGDPSAHVGEYTAILSGSRGKNDRLRLRIQDRPLGCACEIVPGKGGGIGRFHEEARRFLSPRGCADFSDPCFELNTRQTDHRLGVRAASSPRRFDPRQFERERSGRDRQMSVAAWMAEPGRRPVAANRRTLRNRSRSRASGRERHAIARVASSGTPRSCQAARHLLHTGSWPR